MSRVLVAGGLGFIGKHVCAELEAQGHQYEVIDLKSGEDICKCMFTPYYDALILLAANLNHDKQMYLDNLSIYEWLGKQWAFPHVVYASSAAVYQGTYSDSFEYDRPFPQTLYGKSKLLGEEILQATQDSYTILRLANVFGDGEGNGAIDRFKRGENKIFGTGLDVRDYVSVKTVAKAFVKAAVNPVKYRNEIYNISTGEPMTTVEAFSKHGKGVSEYIDPRPFDVKYSVLVNNKAKSAGLIE